MPALRLAALTLLFSGCTFGLDVLGDAPPAQGAGWREMLDEVNAVRARGRYCGETYFPAAPPLVWNGRLETAARRHSEDMARTGRFSHTGSDGSTPGERASRAGYDWRRVAENIARNQHSVQQVVRDWAGSPGHCANLMNASYIEIGAAEVNRHWTQVLGRPR
ncbi:MAG: CAP domain-containing protein [Rubricoccaceae bacterium]